MLLFGANILLRKISLAKIRDTDNVCAGKLSRLWVDHRCLKFCCHFVASISEI